MTRHTKYFPYSYRLSLWMREARVSYRLKNAGENKKAVVHLLCFRCLVILLRSWKKQGYETPAASYVPQS